VCSQIGAQSPHLSTAAIILKNGKFFIARRLSSVSGGHSDMDGKWEFPGGKAETGETAPAALVRELQEEFGVDSTAGRLLAESSFVHNGKTYRLLAFEVFLPEGAESGWTLTEHSDWRWATPEDIETLHAAGDFTPSDYALLPQLLTAIAHCSIRRTSADGGCRPST
jgi:mutator protein MutT